MAVNHPTTPLTTATTPRLSRPADGAEPMQDGARFEAPLYTVPYLVRDCRDACIDTRDLVTEEDQARI